MLGLNSTCICQHRIITRSPFSHAMPFLDHPVRSPELQCVSQAQVQQLQQLAAAQAATQGLPQSMAALQQHIGGSGGGSSASLGGMTAHQSRNELLQAGTMSNAPNGASFPTMNRWNASVHSHCTQPFRQTCWDCFVPLLAPCSPHRKAFPSILFLRHSIRERSFIGQLAGRMRDARQCHIW